MKEMQVNDIAMIKDREVDYYIWGGKKYQFDEMFEIKIDLDPKDRNYDKLKLEYPEGRRSMIFTIDQIYDHLQKGDWADLHPQMPVYKGINSYLKKDSISKTRGIFVVKAYIFLADELNELMNSDDFRSVEVFKQALGSIARLGRAAEVHLALACQRASGNTINGDLKNNIQMSCLLGGFDDVSSSLMFDKDVSHLAKPKIKGRCFIGSGTEIIETQSYWTKPEKDWEFDEDAELTYNNPIFKDQCKLLGKDIDKLNTGWVEQIPYDANGNPEKSESEVTDEEIEKELKDLDDIDLDDDDEEFSDKDFEIFDEDDDEDKEDNEEDDNKAGDIILPKAEDLEPEVEERDIDVDEEPEIDIPQIDPISPSGPKPVKIRFNTNKAESPPPTKIKFNFNKKSDDN